MRVSRTTGAVSGLVIVVLGVWGGLIPFIGPYFNFFFGPNATWHYSADRMWLNILPGAVAVIGGLMIMYAGHRVNGSFGAWLALAAGAWFVVGPTVSLLWRTTGAATVSAPIGTPFGGIHRQILELVGFYYGVGVLIVGFSAFALGRFVSRAALAAEGEEVGPRSLAEVRATEERPVAERPMAEQPETEEQPVAEQPVAHRSDTEPPTTEQPTTEQQTTGQPTSVQEPDTEQPTTVQEPDTEQPTTVQEPDTEQPTTVQEREPAHHGSRD